MNKFIKILLISFVTFSLFSGPNSDLMKAVIHKDLDRAKAAIAAGASVNAQIITTTILIIAANQSSIDIVRLLLDKGANVNATTEDTGNTALIYAASNGHRDIVRLLLKMGANIDHANKAGFTALNSVRRLGRTEIAKILQETPEIKQLVDNAIQGDSSSHQELIEKIKDLNIDSYEFNLILNHLINKIITKNSDVEMPNIRKMLITLVKIMAIEFARYFGFRIESQGIELPQELVIEYLLSQFLKERLSPINLQIKIPMAYGGSENFLQLVAHEYGELEKKVIKIREKRAISSRKQACELM